MVLANLEGAEQALVDAHHGTRVVEFAAVVGSTEESDQLTLREELVPVLDDLMGAADKIHVVFLEETRDDIRTEGERHSTVVFAPSSDILVGIGPEKITEQAAVGDLCAK